MKIEAIKAKINIIMTPHGADFNIPAGVVDSLIRLSVGLEDISDLVADLEGALSKL